jgi:hypothetical protein
MDPYDIYEDVVDLWRQSVLTGGSETREDASLTALLSCDIPLLVEFAKDNDLQYMKIVSTNIGMIRTYQKRYRKRGKK